MIRVDTADTIAAISSPNGPALRSIVRLSGPDCWGVVSRVLKGAPDSQPGAPASFGCVTREESGSYAIPGRLQSWPAGRSYTGQASVELHLDVPNVLADRVLRQCVEAGARLAEPGEFTFRAYAKGRIDLARAEAVAGIFQATTPEQLQVALGQLAGGLGQRIDRLRGRLLDLTAWLEATLDFVEEADVDPISRNVVAEELRGSAWELRRLSEVESKRDRTVSSRRIVLVGRPNAGKSHLFNALCGATGRALVSPVAGTTRDYLEARAELAPGRSVIVVDTAGEYETAEPIDARSQDLGRRERLLADLFLVCVPVDAAAAEVAAFEAVLPGNVPRVIVRTKADLGGPEAEERSASVRVSAATGLGIAELRQALTDRLDGLEPEIDTVVAGTRVRVGEALRSAGRSLAQAAETMAASGGDELVAIDLRAAVEALDVVAGKDATEEVLDRIFSRFCIGK
ncbi:GTP-binding protein [bacterium]|nr:GTP-binding protein [bacterium]